MLRIALLFLLIAISMADTCTYSQRTCFGSVFNWCCSSDETCGSSYGLCNDDSSDLPPAVIAVIIIASVFCFVTCLSCCIQSHQRQQRSHLAMINAQSRAQARPYQNNVVRVIHVRPASHAGIHPAVHAFPSIYEAPPPSYEAAVAASLPATPPMTATTVEV